MTAVRNWGRNDQTKPNSMIRLRIVVCKFKFSRKLGVFEELFYPVPTWITHAAIIALICRLCATTLFSRTILAQRSRREPYSFYLQRGFA